MATQRIGCGILLRAPAQSAEASHTKITQIMRSYKVQASTEKLGKQIYSVMDIKSAN